MRISTQSVTVMIVVPRSRPTFTLGRAACEPNARTEKARRDEYGQADDFETRHG